MERNLYIQNSLLSLVTRFCLKKTGPGEVILIKMVVIKNMGEKIIIRTIELMISSIRLKTLK